MGTGKIKDNYKFYKGYEEEPEIRISTPDKKIEILHIWDGFFYDIFREPPSTAWGGTDLQEIFINLREFFRTMNLHE